jgi:hypothetical protein
MCILKNNKKSKSFIDIKIEKKQLSNYKSYYEKVQRRKYIDTKTKREIER